MSSPPLGPPPRHYRPPGTPPSGGGWTPDQPLGRPRPETPPPRHERPERRRLIAVGAITSIVALVVLAVAMVIVDGEPASTALPTTSLPPATAPTTPPSTNVPVEQFGTDANPIPTGDGYVIGLHEITVLDADRSATDRLLRESRLNLEPPAGETVVLVTVQIRFTERRGFGDSGVFDFVLTDGADTWLELSPSCVSVPDDSGRRALLAPGEQVRFPVCFTVPSTSAGARLLLATESFNGLVYFDVP